MAGKLLPAHPTGRYSGFTNLWKKTRRPSGYLPRPATCATKENDLFPCCLSCGVTDPENIKELLARRSANAGWLTADWWWDFGWVLPAGFVSYGIGITVPNPPVERDRVFVHKPNLSRGYLDLDLKAHAKAGADQHEAKVQILSSVSQLVSFEGQIIADSLGTIAVAVPRTTWFLDGKEIYKRFIFERPVMATVPPDVLLHGDNIKVEEDKVLFNGIQL